MNALNVAIDWWARIAEVVRRHDAATAALAQTLRDANADHGDAITVEVIGQVLDRTAAILRQMPRPARPTLATTVYLRGAGCDDETWRLVQEAMWARGWDTERHRTSAWYRARGGVPVVMCDFSTDLGEPGNRVVSVWRMRAVYRDGPDHNATSLERVCGTNALYPWRRLDPTDGIPAGFGDGKNTLDEQALAQLVTYALSLRGGVG